MADGRGGDGAKAGVGDVVYYRVRGECGNGVWAVGGGIGALKPFAVDVVGGGFGSCWGGRGIVVYSGGGGE